MPTLDEVLSIFPDKKFIVEVKDWKIETYEALWKKLSTMPAEKVNLLSVVCANDDGAKYLRSQSSELKIMSKNSMIKALVKYELFGWTGYIPQEIRNTDLRIPLTYAKFLWGWPYKFMERMEKTGTRVEITAGGSGLSEGFDTVESLKSAPKKFPGFIWTNRIDIVNPVTAKE